MPRSSQNPVNMVIDKRVGSRVRMRRMMLSMSQEELGDGLGVTFQQVQKYEKGTNRMGASRLQTIANILQVPVSFFFEGQEKDSESKRSSMPTLSEFQVKVLKEVETIVDPDYQDFVLQIARACSAKLSKK